MPSVAATFPANFLATSLASLLVVFAADAAWAQLPFELPPINYSTSEPSDPVADLKSKLSPADVPLAGDDPHRQLRWLLKRLDIPVSSQTLVFSKTSQQRHRISPEHPRAIYFNDHSYVGWIPHAELIEIASSDPQLGTNFYIIDQRQTVAPVRIERRSERCLFCHASSNTGRVPGLLMQSVFSGPDGSRVFPTASIRPRADGPLGNRFAGWFVTGHHGGQSHLGNLIVRSGDTIQSQSLRNNGNRNDLSDWFDSSNYLSPHSDLIALLVLQHQVTMHNLLTDANHRTRTILYESTLHLNNQSDASERDRQGLTKEDRILIDQIAQRLTDGLLMVDSLTLAESVTGTSHFADEFVRRGPMDSLGRSLRELDLQDALFAYPCSYLIYSESFDSLPRPLIKLVYKRLRAVLEMHDTRQKYAHISPAQRQAIAQILFDTKPAFR